MPLLILDGSIASLTLAWREAASRPPVPASAKAGDEPFYIWVPAADSARLGDRALTIAQLCQATLLIEQPTEAWPLPSARTGRAEASVLLFRAALVALERNCTRVIWPVHTTLADGLAAAARAFDRGLILRELLSLDAPDSPIAFEMPLLELSDEAVADLAIDLGVPLQLAAFCRNSPAAACTTCPSCRRWLTAAAAVGASLHSL